jgi:hypothetical protein
MDIKELVCKIKDGSIRKKYPGKDERHQMYRKSIGKCKSLECHENPYGAYDFELPNEFKLYPKDTLNRKPVDAVDVLRHMSKEKRAEYMNLALLGSKFPRYSPWDKLMCERVYEIMKSIVEYFENDE